MFYEVEGRRKKGICVRKEGKELWKEAREELKQGKKRDRQDGRHGKKGQS